MNRIVRENYSVAGLPGDSCKGLQEDDVVGEPIQIASAKSDRIPTLKNLLAIRRPPYRSTEEIVEELRQERDAWDC